MAAKKEMSQLSKTESAELARALKAYIAACNLRIKLIKALGSKERNPEHDQHYEDAIAHIHGVEEALQKVTGKIRKL
jgi:hypothetical protein